MLNKVTLIGNVGNDPEIKTFSAGGKIASFSLATTEKRKNKEGATTEHTEWHRVVIKSENIANLVEKYVKKGSKLYLEGVIRSRKYNDNEGVEKNIVEIVLQTYGGVMKFLSSSKNSDDKTQHSHYGQYAKEEDTKDDIVDDDIPF